MGDRMIYIYTALLGLAASVVASYGVSFLAACAGWMYFGEGFWLVQISWLPCMLAGVLICFVPERRPWLHAVWIAYFTVVLSSSAGAIGVGAMRVGLESVNKQGYLTGCWIYGVIWLPFSYPLAYVLIRCVHRLHVAK